jgi:hypothetical protein
MSDDELTDEELIELALQVALLREPQWTLLDDARDVVVTHGTVH